MYHVCVSCIFIYIRHCCEANCCEAIQPANNSSLTTLHNTKVLDLRLSIHTLTFTAPVAGQYINTFVSCHVFGNMLICPFIGTLTCVTAAC